MTARIHELAECTHTEEMCGGCRAVLRLLGLRHVDRRQGLQRCDDANHQAMILIRISEGFDQSSLLSHSEPGCSTAPRRYPGALLG